MTCAFSGHRPEKLPWGTDESDPHCVALKIIMERQLRKLCESGVDHFICGMARGTDQYFLELLVKLKKEYGFTVEAAIPCPSQPDSWPREDQKRYYRNLGHCDSVYMAQEAYSEGCMDRRNRYMVEHADILMTVFDGSPGGTASTVAYARARGVKIVPIWR